MRAETKMRRILESDASDRLKVLRLQTLALRCLASSPIQKEVIAAYKAIQGWERANDGLGAC